MKKITRNLLAVSLALLVLFAVTGCNNGTTNDDLQVKTIEVLPYAYLNEVFDLRDVILMEDGVEYSAQVC